MQEVCWATRHPGMGIDKDVARVEIRESAIASHAFTRGAWVQTSQLGGREGFPEGKRRASDVQ